jgi:cytochrome b561
MSQNASQRYGLIMRLLHWLIALTIITQIIIAIAMENITGPIVRDLYFVHKSLGLTLLSLGTLFVAWRVFNKSPALSNPIPIWQRYAANIVHFLLYCLILIMPLSGWLMSSAAGYPPSFWGWFTVAAPLEQSQTVADFFGSVHEVCAWIMSALIIIHILAALKHALINKDDVLKQML